MCEVGEDRLLIGGERGDEARRLAAHHLAAGGERVLDAARRAQQAEDARRDLARGEHVARQEQPGLAAGRGEERRPGGRRGARAGERREGPPRRRQAPPQLAAEAGGLDGRVAVGEDARGDGAAGGEQAEAAEESGEGGAIGRRDAQHLGLQHQDGEAAQLPGGGVHPRRRVEQEIEQEGDERRLVALRAQEARAEIGRPGIAGELGREDRGEVRGQTRDRNRYLFFAAFGFAAALGAAADALADALGADALADALGAVAALAEALGWAVAFDVAFEVAFAFGAPFPWLFVPPPLPRAEVNACSSSLAAALLNETWTLPPPETWFC